MKVILNKDVKGLGKKGDVVEASDGYARNFLIPKKVASEATEGNVKSLNMKKRAEEEKLKEELNDAKKLAKVLEGVKVEIYTKAGEGGRLFGSVTSKEIAENLKKKFKIDIDKRKINLKDPIKTLGTTNVEVKIHPKVKAKLSVNVKEKTK